MLLFARLMESLEFVFNLFILRYVVRLRVEHFKWITRLEDPDSEETKEFVQNQVKLTETVLKTCDVRDKLHEKITKLFDHPRYEAPFRRGNKYFYFHNTGLQAQNVLYVQVCLFKSGIELKENFIYASFLALE